MALLQALLTLIAKSAGKILNAIFGWAVRALFGQTTAKEQTVLSGVVAAAVAWPVLLVGVAFPKAAALALALVPIPGFVPSWIVRLVWVGLALLVPLVLGLAVTTKAPPALRGEHWLKRLLRGFPITVGLAAAFVFMFVSVPLLKLAALVRRQISADIPLVTSGPAYEQAADIIESTLDRHGFHLDRHTPPWWITAPGRILQKLGGEAFRHYVPLETAHYRSPSLEMSLYPSGVLLRGARQHVTWAQGLVGEVALACDGTETTTPSAMRLEKELRRLWKVVARAPEAHRHSPVLASRVRDMTEELATVDLPLEDWRILYRQLLQMSRALEGEPQLLEATAGKEKAIMSTGDQAERPLEEAELQPVQGAELAALSEASPPPLPPEAMSTSSLVKEAVQDLAVLARKELALAKAELQGDLRAELGVAKGLALSALAALLLVNALVVAAILAVAQVIPGWAAALAASGVLLIAAVVVAMWSWRKRVRQPLGLTRRSLRENVRHFKEWTA